MSQWRSPYPTVAADLLRHVRVEWWIAGGWAIELFVRREVRDHSDLEIGCFRPDLGKVVAQLSGWDLMVARDGHLNPCRAASLAEPDIHSIWCRPSGSAYWVLEILVEDRNAADWIYRRDAWIRRPVGQVMARSEEEMLYLRPEIQLLYKSKSPRPKDDVDFIVAWPLLEAEAKAWLANTVSSVSPSCGWDLST